jgi:hypothetical protein
MGLLDRLTDDTGASPWGVLYQPSPVTAAPSMFGAGAPPVPYPPGPVTAQPTAGPATHFSLANRAPAAPGASAPDQTVPIGIQADGSSYTMPMFGKTAAAPAAPAAAAPTAEPGVGDRLASGFRGMAANIQGGPIGILMGGVAGLAGMGQGNIQGNAQGNATARALLAKGASPADVQAAQNNPDVMKALVTQYYGPKVGAARAGNNPNLIAAGRAPSAPAPGSIQNGYRFRGGNPADRNNWEHV